MTIHTCFWWYNDDIRPSCLVVALSNPFPGNCPNIFKHNYYRNIFKCWFLVAQTIRSVLYLFFFKSIIYINVVHLRHSFQAAWLDLMISASSLWAVQGCAWEWDRQQPILHESTHSGEVITAKQEYLTLAHTSGQRPLQSPAISLRFLQTHARTEPETDEIIYY